MYHILPLDNIIHSQNCNEIKLRNKIKYIFNLIKKEI